jgi:hypothetical protein
MGFGRSAAVGILQRAVQEMHWISIVCFLEQVNHDDLLLLPEVASRIGVELAQLRAYNPLEAYAAGLVHLCRGEQRGTTQGVVSPEENLHAES